MWLTRGVMKSTKPFSQYVLFFGHFFVVKVILSQDLQLSSVSDSVVHLHECLWREVYNMHIVGAVGDVWGDALTSSNLLEVSLICHVPTHLLKIQCLKILTLYPHSIILHDHGRHWKPIVPLRREFIVRADQAQLHNNSQPGKFRSLAIFLNS